MKNSLFSVKNKEKLDLIFVSRSSVFMSMASGGEGSSASPHKHTNRLAKERSPYLLQHAHNPVDW